MEISTGAYGACELEPVCAETSAFSFGVPRRWRAFAVLLASPLIASNAGSVSWSGRPGIPRAGQVVIVRRSLLKRRGYL